MLKRALELGVSQYYLFIVFTHLSVLYMAGAQMLSLLEFNIQTYLTWDSFKHQEAPGCKRLQQFTALLRGHFQLEYLLIDCVNPLLEFFHYQIDEQRGRLLHRLMLTTKTHIC